jgi:type IV fimbrial biogenesis protein FimT
MRAAAGLTLIEVMITLAVFGIVVMLGLPAFTVWINNAQIRTGAEAILNGMQLARAEAVRRNANIQLVLDPPRSAWTVSVVATAEVIQSRTEQEGSRNAVVTATPLGTHTITFNGYGRVVGNADASLPVTQVDVDSAVLAPADSRELRITVGAGGNVRMCDPQVSAPDPRAC